MRIVTAAAAIVGAALIVAGMFMLAPAAGVITGGVILVSFGLLYDPKAPR